MLLFLLVVGVRGLLFVVSCSSLFNVCVRVLFGVVFLFAAFVVFVVRCFWHVLFVAC